MKKITLSLIVFSALLTASEFQYGSGTFNMKGGFLGLTGTIGTDVETFTLAERHSNMAGSDVFYSYDFTWYDSKTMKQAQHTYNNMVTVANGFNPISSSVWEIPSMDHRIKGLDANIRVGYDVIHEGEGDFLGLGVLVGLSMPWIDSSTDDDAEPSFGFIRDNVDNLLTAADYFKASKTEMMTYKIGPSVNFQKTLVSDKLSVYGIASLAYQTGYIKNDYAKSKFTVNGSFQEVNVGLHYTPFTENYEFGWLTLSPRIYATLGYKYSKWDVDEMIINISGAEMSSKILDPLGMKFGFDSSIGYFGLGYSF
jgi:hypothetical protein